MNSKVNTQSQTMSAAEYRYQLEEYKQQEEQKRKTLLEQKRRESHNTIDFLCDDNQHSYSSMIDLCQDMEMAQIEKRNMTQELNDFLAAKKLNYKYEDIDESLYRQMKLRRLAYYLLPALDVFFAYLALEPLVSNVLIELTSLSDGMAKAIGAILSVLVGLGVSLLSRIGMASMDVEDPNNHNGLIVVGSVLILPIIYIGGEIAFRGGNNWIYSGIGALASLIIQLLIVKGYKHQIEALNYFDKIKKNKMTKAKEDAKKKEHCDKIADAENKIQTTIARFREEYNHFIEYFRNLAKAYEEHKKEFNEDVELNLGQIIIFMGNLTCYRCVKVPFKYDRDGSISLMPQYEFPSVSCCKGISKSKDFEYLKYMRDRDYLDPAFADAITTIENKSNYMIGESSQSQDGPIQDGISEDIDG